MNHYTYEIEFENGMKYVGVRSCKTTIEKDSYYGSSRIIPAKLYETCKKRILNTFETRIEALNDEIRLHEELDVAVNKNYYNQVKQTSDKFNQQGTTKETHEHIARMAEKLKGRTKEDWSYLEDSGKKSAAKRGDNRTEAQKTADANVSKFQKGKKNTNKGNTGTSSHKYRPWYYVTPEGEYNEVFTTVRNYALDQNNEIGMSYTKLSYSLRENSHMPMLRGKFKGYLFGYLDTKPEYLTQENIHIAIQVLKHIPFESPNKESYGSGGIKNITGKK